MEDPKDLGSSLDEASANTGDAHESSPRHLAHEEEVQVWSQLWKRSLYKSHVAPMSPSMYRKIFVKQNHHAKKSETGLNTHPYQAIYFKVPKNILGNLDLQNSLEQANMTTFDGQNFK